jgi:hypothetical protein
VKPVIAVLWILSIALAIGLTRLAGPERAGSEPSPSLDEAFGEYDPLRRAFLISHALQDFGPDDLPELMRVLVDRREGITPEEVRLVMLAWARFDGPGAYAWATEGPKPWRKTLTGEAMFAWAYHDGPAAIAVVEEAENPERMIGLTQQALQGWIRSDDKQGVAEYISTTDKVERRSRYYFLLGGEVVMREGTDAAMRWVESFPDDAPNQLKSALFRVVSDSVVVENPVRAVEWFLENRTRSFTRRSLSRIARAWGRQQDPSVVFEWLLAMSTEGLREGERDDAIALTFRAWIQTKPEAAQSWLLSALPNPALDPAVREAVKRLMPTDPDVAMEWARRLDDEAARHGQSSRVGIRWRDKDPEAFHNWLRESDLPEETRQKIMAAPKSLKRPVRTKAKPEPVAVGKP